MDSRIRSAWPLWRQYSSIMCTRIQRRLDGGPGRDGRYDATATPARRGWASASWNDPVGDGDRLVVQLPELLGGCPGPARVPLPVAVGLPVDRGPRLGRRVVGVDLVEPPVLDVREVLEQPAERHRRRLAAAGRAGRRRGPRSSAAGCRGGSRGSRAGSRPRILRGADRCGSCRPDPIRRRSRVGALRRRVIQIVSASSTNGPNGEHQGQHLLDGVERAEVAAARPTAQPMCG